MRHGKAFALNKNITKQNSNLCIVIMTKGESANSALFNMETMTFVVGEKRNRKGVGAG